ncbi:hypothetical protein NE235_22510 [Actinoallomurus spadix]|uniref:L-tyrosine 3-hydroxylase n=1 Tax=Actinoallomurus spadix TaxID=79912 RepID=A0ABN0XFM6_9ACTN|nr:hypothetical protein [Actinoallomurus spadix]MCO5988882.1 hypothetical protein [Actinoallomurus spadix]
MTATLDHPAFGPVQKVDLGLLVLPLPDQPFAACDGPTHHRVSAHETLIDADENTRGWYRWLLGHHVTFCIWRLMSESLGAVLAGRAEAADTVARLYDAYSALLLYAGSCTPAVYDSVIRSRMRARHPAFSGTWARDYREVLVRLAAVAPAPGTPLKESLKLNRLAHMSMAARLVPSGGSLLRDAGRDAHQAPTVEESDLLDSFFLTGRRSVCSREFVEQLHHRTRAVLTDLEHQPLEVRYDRAALDDLQARITTHIAFPAQAAEAILTEGTDNRG